MQALAAFQTLLLNCDGYSFLFEAFQSTSTRTRLQRNWCFNRSTAKSKEKQNDLTNKKQTHRTVVFSSISSSMVLVYLFGLSSICNDSNIPKFGVNIVIVLNRRILKVEEYMIKFSALTLFFVSIFYILCTSTAEVNQTTENKNCDTQTHHAILCLAIYSQYS